MRAFGRLFAGRLNIFDIAQSNYNQSSMATDIFRRVYPEPMLLPVVVRILEREQKEIVSATQVNVLQTLADPM